MIGLFSDPNGAVYQWVVRNLAPGEPGLAVQNDMTVAVREDGELLAGAVYSLCGPAAWITIYASSPRWARKGIIRQIVSLALSTTAMIAKCSVAAGNRRANRLLRGLGFVKEGVFRYGRPDGSHAAVWSMTRAEMKKQRWSK